MILEIQGFDILGDEELALDILQALNAFHWRLGQQIQTMFAVQAAYNKVDAKIRNDVHKEVKP